MDKIYLNKLAFYGYHGVFPEENKLGQRFFVDLILEADLTQSSLTDDIENTVDYGQLHELTQKIVEGPPRRLVETLTEDIAGQVLKEFPIIQSCTVKVAKPDPPIPGHYHSVAVEMTRSRT